MIEHQKVKIIGHTDAVGPEDPDPANDKLGNKEWSRRRAEAVRDYIVTNYGLSASMFDVQAKGSSQLKDPSNPRSSVNRRVVIELK